MMFGTGRKTVGRLPVTVTWPSSGLARSQHEKACRKAKIPQGGDINRQEAFVTYVLPRWFMIDG